MRRSSARTAARSPSSKPPSGPTSSAAIAAAPAVFARTERHPAASVLTGATFFDDVYDAADTMDEVYTTIVERLVALQRQVILSSPVTARR